MWAHLSSAAGRTAAARCTAPQGGSATAEDGGSSCPPGARITHGRRETQAASAAALTASHCLRTQRCHAWSHASAACASSHSGRNGGSWGPPWGPCAAGCTPPARRSAAARWAGWSSAAAPAPRCGPETFSGARWACLQADGRVREVVEACGLGRTAPPASEAGLQAASREADLRKRDACAHAAARHQHQPPLPAAAVLCSGGVRQWAAMLRLYSLLVLLVLRSLGYKSQHSQGARHSCSSAAHTTTRAPWRSKPPPHTNLRSRGKGDDGVIGQLYFLGACYPMILKAVGARSSMLCAPCN